jgi:hypothetical protein
MKAAGMRAHNERVGSAIHARGTFTRNLSSKRRSMGLAEARMTRLRRKVRAVNPRLAARRDAGRGVMLHAKGGSSHRLWADTSKVTRRPKRLYKRDSRGRFARR